MPSGVQVRGGEDEDADEDGQWAMKMGGGQKTLSCQSAAVRSCVAQKVIALQM